MDEVDAWRNWVDGWMDGTPEGVPRGAPVQALVWLRAVRNGGHRLNALHDNNQQVSLGTFCFVSLQGKATPLQCNAGALKADAFQIQHGKSQGNCCRKLLDVCRVVATPLHLTTAYQTAIKLQNQLLWPLMHAKFDPSTMTH